MEVLTVRALIFFTLGVLSCLAVNTNTYVVSKRQFAIDHNYDNYVVTKKKKLEVWKDAGDDQKLIIKFTWQI